MSGTALTMTSPSTVRPTRSTPCVDGCCGPRLMNIWSVLRRPTVSACEAERSRSFIVAVLDVGVIFAQGMSLQEIGGQDLGQVRMPLVNHAEQVENLALLPVRGLEQADEAGRGRRFARRLQADDHARLVLDG